MKSSTKTSLAVSVSLAALAVAGGALFIGSGVYDIGADDHHTKLVLAVIERLRDHSIEARTRRLEVHTISDPARLAAGAQHYAALCVSCHLAPGVTKSDIRPGLYPHPPNLAQEDIQSAPRAFWIIKHGIKMSAMPAWGKTLDDAAIWDLVAFVRKLPEMTPETYAELSNAR
jgi:cytochrome c553